MSQSSRAAAVAGTAVKTASVPTAARTSRPKPTCGGGCTVDQARNNLSPKPSKPPDSTCSQREKFKLPANTTGEQLRDLKFLRERVWPVALHHGCSLEIDWELFVGHAINVCDEEKSTPARLFTTAMRTGLRTRKEGKVSKLVPYLSVVTFEQQQRAKELIRSEVPPELQRRSGGLFGDEHDFEQRKREMIRQARRMAGVK